VVVGDSDAVAGLVRFAHSAHIALMHLHFMDWLVLGAFVVPTAVVACLWAARDLHEKSQLWPVRSQGKGMAGHRIRDSFIVLFWIGAAAAAAAAFRLFLR
jgi:hypothetical protein